MRFTCSLLELICWVIDYIRIYYIRIYTDLAVYGSGPLGGQAQAQAQAQAVIRQSPGAR